MKIRHLLMTAATFGALSASGALAADMAEYPAPDVVYADAPDCNDAALRRADKVYLPPQTAYILAGCGGPRQHWTGLLGKRPTRILVYYNGGSMYRTDITSIRVGH